MVRGRRSTTSSQDRSWAIVGTIALAASVMFVGYAAFSHSTQGTVDNYVSASVNSAAVSPVSPVSPAAPVTTTVDAPPTVPPSPVVYFIGDSFSVGTPEATFPALIAATKGWQPQCICAVDAGYVADTSAPTKMAFAQEITNNGLSKASRVVVSGGSGDLDDSEQDFDASVKATADAIKTAAPGVPVTFLSTFYSNTQNDVPESVLTMNATIQRYAAESGAQYIDVTQLFYGHDDALAPDGLTPNEVGQRLIADTVGPQIVV